MKKIHILFSSIVFMFIILFNCQQSGGSGGVGDDTTSKWTSQKKIIAPDAADSDEFGDSVSISGDYAIVGAFSEDGIGTDRGAAYIFHRTETNTWDSGFKLTAPDTQDSDYFGSVSISGDYAIVGAKNEDGIGTDRGAAYIFHRTGTNTWDSGFKLTAPDTQDSDYFGSVSISGDYAIVGAKNEDGIGTDRGAAYIFHRTGTNIWDSGFKVTALDAADNDLFGNSVSISGDYAIAGAYHEDDIGVDRGAVYIFHRTGENIWDSGIKKIAADPEDGEFFGNSVSISGDYVIAGAYFENGGGMTIRGAAYIYHRYDINNWDFITKIIAPDTEGNDKFGISVSISGDYAIIGARDEDGIGTNRGAAYIFQRIGTNTWNEGFKIIASDAVNQDGFGNAVSISGSYAIVGAGSKDNGGISRGASYIFK